MLEDDSFEENPKQGAEEDEKDKLDKSTMKPGVTKPGSKKNARDIKVL